MPDFTKPAPDARHVVGPAKSHHASPGKQTLVEQLAVPAVQRAGPGSGARDEASVHAAASRGIATPASPLPYADTIQRAFGRHDISAVQAHTGGEAAASASAMGADAYATGNQVVLGGGTDLHTVAHEAAHVVQQRGGVQLKGGVGASGTLASTTPMPSRTASSPATRPRACSTRASGPHRLPATSVQGARSSRALAGQQLEVVDQNGAKVLRVMGEDAQASAGAAKNLTTDAEPSAVRSEPKTERRSGNDSAARHSEPQATAKADAGDTSSLATGRAELRGPARRHWAATVNQGTVARNLNTVIEPGVDVAADVTGIRTGKATRVDGGYVINGRTYGAHDGTLTRSLDQAFINSTAVHFRRWAY